MAVAGWIGIGALLVLWLVIRWEGQWRPHPMPMRWEQFFLDNPLRRKWFGANRVLSPMGNLRGSRVGEIGVGVGVVVEALADAVGSEGEVWGIDIQPAAVRATVARLARRHWEGRAHLTVADAADLPWSADSLDWVCMVSVFGEIPAAARSDLLQSIARVLKTSGRLAITEYWPDPHYQPPASMRRQLEVAGYQIRGYWHWPLVYTLVAVPDLVDSLQTQS